MKASGKFVEAYIECALWSSTDESGESFEGLELSDETREKMQADCDAFVEANTVDLENLDDAQSGHDFWLTRNGHGAGFWDRGLGELGERLSKASKNFGEVYLYCENETVWEN
jgi:hypothetical protein